MSVSLHIFTKITVFIILFQKILLSKYWALYELGKGQMDPYMTGHVAQSKKSLDFSILLSLSLSLSLLFFPLPRCLSTALGAIFSYEKPVLSPSTAFNPPRPSLSLSLLSLTYLSLSLLYASRLFLPQAGPLSRSRCTDPLSHAWDR